MAHFAEKAGVVTANTAWGNWSQTIDEVFVEVQSENGLRTRDVKCSITANSISLTIRGKEILKGHLYGTILTEESIWTIGRQPGNRSTHVLINLIDFTQCMSNIMTLKILCKSTFFRSRHNAWAFFVSLPVWLCICC